MTSSDIFSNCSDKNADSLPTTSTQPSSKDNNDTCEGNYLADLFDPLPDDDFRYIR